MTRCRTLPPARQSSNVFSFCNIHTFNLARQSSAFANALAGATMFNDGVALDAASLVLFGKAFPDNLNGTDLTPALLAPLDRRTSIYFFGGRPGMAEQAAPALQARFPNIAIAGCEHGDFAELDESAVAERISGSEADLVLVEMGNLWQELCANRFSTRTGAATLCIGAYLDFATGRVPRARKLARLVRREWAFRLALEPRRLARRYLVRGFLSWQRYCMNSQLAGRPAGAERDKERVH